ncbi:zinc-dependent dehydrogenase [Candidatus Nitrosotenuis uzonensis]|uniref:Alcohol dehydrogenase zinc-binding domain protein n=1 Tax=Candidatus Nitrosotenuis uzonensis TaxID=1407055 RepID=A0A812EWY3_9ARCH|nr:zinc-dependent dehydrogenase [Candidatus Nitrosotenuis uzonensis]CAE6497541.1 Alcohol dehydrogenase zinc-binding domain protein [Candidatus Nitrosotenuis uzonensis]
MKTAFVKGPSSVEVVESTISKLAPGEILVKMQSCGICGSDVEKVFGKYGQPSMRLGHEPAGIIIAVGDKISEFKVGDRVFTHHHVPCYSCHFCVHGNETMCQRYSDSNLNPCGLSEEYIVPEWNVSHGGVLKIPDHMSFDEAAMIEPLACCVRAWNKFSHRLGDSAAIFGTGPTGVMHAMIAQSNGFSQVFCFDVNDFRLDFARQLGALPLKSGSENSIETLTSSTQGHGVDVSIIATSHLDAITDAIACTRKGGTIILFGVPTKGATMNIDMSIIYAKELTLVPTYAASDIDTKQALELIATGKVDVKKLITHRYSLAESQKAFEHAHTGQNAMKIIIHS